MALSNYDKFKALLQELFMFDQADLDFGIYRIMNVKRDEINRFLENDLLPQAQHALEALDAGERARVEAELAKAEDAVRALKVAPEDSEVVKELRDRLKKTMDVTAVGNEVFSHLYNFFSRYYDSGDFISKRRYKPGVYAIPYEGEEVKLHWANSDQYYIKSSEHFRDYAFRLGDGRRVHFKIVSADTELNNNKPTNGQERKFFLASTEPIAVVDGELVIRFEYKSENGQGNGETEEQEEKAEQAKPVKKVNGAERNAEIARRILSDPVSMSWAAALSEPSKNPERTLLDRHLNEYTARTKFDYFIHKDLSGFLRRELDFFIKNEIVHLDEIDTATAPSVEQYLAKVKALRHVGHKIIDFLAQIEDFQKQLWLKKKFVIETNYCITLDRIPKNLYSEIAANDAQRQEWVQLFAIDRIQGNLTTAAYSEPLTVEFLSNNPFLVVDTRFFSCDFVNRLLSGFADLSSEIQGITMWSENFQALNLLRSRFWNEIQSIYIDPPYNTNASPILYKNDYRHSSWLTYVRDRIALGREMLEDAGILCVTIDDIEFHRLRSVVQEIFGESLIRGVVAIKSNPSGRSTVKGFAIAHEYGIFAASSDSARIGRLERTEEQLARYDQKDEKSAFEWVNFRKHGGANAERAARRKLFYPIYACKGGIRIPRLEWNQFKREWNALDPPSSEEEVIFPINPKGEEKTWKWAHTTVLDNIKDLCSRPEQTGKTGVYVKARINQAGTLPLTWWDKTEYSATEYGTNLLADILGASNKFSFPKSVHAVQDSLRVTNLGAEKWVMDFFAGSGTTAHAAMQMTRDDGERRRFVLVEAGDYFETVLMPRVKKCIYSGEWKDGKPVDRDGISQFVQCCRLESYEDTLNNLLLAKSSAQKDLLTNNSSFREDYTLHYMLDAETNGSRSLLNIDYFEDPFHYTMQIATSTAGETRTLNVDLVETFNYLLGLRVKQLATLNGFKVVEGRNSDDEPVLVIWRNTKEKSNADLDAFFQSQGYGAQDRFNLAYVNGDNNLENLRPEGASWKVLLIEEEFKRLMFDVKDV